MAIIGTRPADSGVMKNRRRTTTKTKRRSAPKVSVRRKPSVANADTKIALIERERDEALEREKATAEVLRVISSSPGDLKPAFAVILENATRLCQANFGVLFLCEGDAYRAVAMHNAPSAYVDARQREPLVSMSGTTVIAEVARTKRTIQTADMAKDPAYQKNPQYTQLFVRLTGARSFVGVPMLKDKELVGVIGIYRPEVRPFTDKQIELLQNFAAQAVIAIENTRLLSELRQSLEQQTATSEVLKVISTSPGELEAVFQSVLEKAVRLCDATFGVMYRYDDRDRTYTAVALFGAPAALQENYGKQGAFTPAPGSSLDHIARTGGVVNKADASAEPAPGAPVIFGGARSLTCVPMTKDSRLIGAITIYRQEVRPFTDKQVELVQRFAAQAVIAIENTRLLNELRQRTTDLTKSLEQQTATSEVLSVISSSPGDLQPVFQAMLENAVRICEAKFGVLYRYDNEDFDAVAHFGVPPALAEFNRRRSSFRSDAGTALDRLLRTKDVVRIADDFAEPTPSAPSKFGGARSVAVVPMLKDKALIGVISISREEVRPFTDKQIELVQNFAAQAVIAIENTRLLNELRKSLQQQTATADVLRVISASPGELMPVFNAMLENATRLCEASYGTMWLRESDGQIRRAANYGTLPEAFQEKWRVGTTFQPSPSLPTARAFETGKPVQVIDLKNDPSYLDRDPLAVAAVEIAGIRSLISVPMLREGANVGTLNVYRREVLPFTDKQIELLTNFAAQAVIAIENTRLLNELRQSTDDLSESLEQQTATSEVLKVISSSPGELQPVFQTMLQNATQICAAKFGALYLHEAGEVRLVAGHDLPTAFAAARMDLSFVPASSSALGQAVRTKEMVYIADLAATPAYARRESRIVEAVEVGGIRTVVAVPLLKEDELVGVISIYRQAIRPFTDKQIALVQNFAAQAVIAIENTRLLNELRESLQQQTATADVLKVISRSTFDLRCGPRR